MQRSAGTNISAASQACAVCKYQRKKCTPNCPLAPFFPASNHKDFLDTRKLFGVRNITKLIEKLDPQQRVIAMKSIIFQANTRANDPVGGCYRIISELQTQIDWYKSELELVRYQLSICKAQAAATQQQSGQQMNMMVQVVDDDQQQVNAIDDQGLEGFNMYDALSVHDHRCQGGEGNIFQDSYAASSSLSPVYNVFDPNSVKVESEASLVPLLYKRALSDVDEDIKPLLAVYDDKGAGAFPLDSKGSNIQCSDKLVSTEEIGSIRHEPKHDLKDAASLLTLTNGKG
ncbi:LOB domain-containing protein 7-like [Durio zibethinus]|uniref:LOB domain-containing protein 7-like n=1 Tax=Durio zibethinus TaxID=66656 RepID=A0A6P5ZBA1_DURZI|nr:LOB domain-containing protein 7-like [Durio zibethinus]